MFLLYHAYVYLEFLILACTIYILAPLRKKKFVNGGDANDNTDGTYSVHEFIDKRCRIILPDRER